jgi:rare lipoprotein A
MKSILILCFLFCSFFATSQAGFEELGTASFYADKFHGKKTASGEVYDKNDLTCAHNTLAFGTMLRVTNLASNNSVIVRVNDRGPHTRGAIVDLSYAAAESIDLIKAGRLKVKIQVISMDEIPMAKTFPVESQPFVADERMEIIAKANTQSSSSATAPVAKETEIRTASAKSPVQLKESEIMISATSDEQAEELVTGATFKNYASYRIELREPSPAHGFIVQVASLSSFDTALKEIARLQQQAQAKTLLITEKGKNGTIFKLAVGPFTERQEADQMRNKLAKKGFPKCFVAKD